MKIRRPRLLYIFPDTVGPSRDPERNALHFLGDFLEGDVLAVLVPNTWGSLGGSKSDAVTVNNFRFIPVREAPSPDLLSKIADTVCFLKVATKLRREGNRYDVVVAHGMYRTGLIAMILAFLWRLPLVVEVPGHPLKGMELDRSLFGRLKRKVAPAIVRLVTGRTNALRLLYPNQLSGVPRLDPSLADRTHIFHDFVPVTKVPLGKARTNEVLFVGFPWYLKGVDILIAAFVRILVDYPDMTLRIIGYCPDLEPWKTLALHDSRIVFQGPTSNEEVLGLMSTARVFVLPSRTEAMGRVLLEAMAAGTPIVASRVDGIPHYIRDGIDGVLFEPEDVDDLERALREVLGSPEAAIARALVAKEKVTREYSEATYARRFEATVKSAMQNYTTKRKGSR